MPLISSIMARIMKQQFEGKKKQHEMAVWPANTEEKKNGEDRITDIYKNNK